MQPPKNPAPAGFFRFGAILYFSHPGKGRYKFSIAPSKNLFTISLKGASRR